jgi:hypothetical protein
MCKNVCKIWPLLSRRDLKQKQIKKRRKLKIHNKIKDKKRRKSVISFALNSIKKRRRVSNFKRNITKEN